MILNRIFDRGVGRCGGCSCAKGHGVNDGVLSRRTGVGKALEATKASGPMTLDGCVAKKKKSKSWCGGRSLDEALESLVASKGFVAEPDDKWRGRLSRRGAGSRGEGGGGETQDCEGRAEGVRW